MGTLAACEYSTLKILSKQENFHLANVKFTKIESVYDTSRFLKGGPSNKIDEIFIDLEIESSNSQEEVDRIHQKTILCCPVYQMLTAAGIKITQNWIKK